MPPRQQIKINKSLELGIEFFLQLQQMSTNMFDFISTLPGKPGLRLPEVLSTWPAPGFLSGSRPGIERGLG